MSKVAIWLLTTMASTLFAEPAVLIEAESDTVTKFIYVGSSPNSTSHPAVSVEGKALGLSAKAEATDGSAAIIGKVTGYTLPNPGALYSTAGVLGAGDYGLMGEGADVGVHGKGSNKGIHGTATATSGIAVYGYSSASGSKGVYGEGIIGVHGKTTTSNSNGVYGEATSSGSAGIKGFATHNSSVGVLGNAGYGRGVRGQATYIGVSGEGEYVGVEGIATGYGGRGVYGYSDYPGFAGYFDGDVYATGIYDGSDRILKEDVKSINKGLDVVLLLAPKSYRMKNGVTRAKYSNREEYGFIAQDLESIIPEIVRNVKSNREMDDGGNVKAGSEIEFKAVNYSGLIPILVKAIQEQQAQIDLLKQRLQER